MELLVSKGVLPGNSHIPKIFATENVWPFGAPYEVEPTVNGWNLSSLTERNQGAVV